MSEGVSEDDLVANVALVITDSMVDGGVPVRACAKAAISTARPIIAQQEREKVLPIALERARQEGWKAGMEEAFEIATDWERDMGTPLMASDRIRARINEGK